MADFPKTPEALSKAGYIYLGDSHCKAKECGALIHWYKFSPTGQKMPIDSITHEPHWKCCIGSDQFRNKKKKEKPKPPPPPELQRNMFEREPGED